MSASSGEPYVGARRTVLIFAEYFRAQPLVRAVRWDKFVLLFNTDDHSVRARRNWDPCEDEAALAIVVERKDVSTWIFSDHPDSVSQVYTRGRSGDDRHGARPCARGSSREVNHGEILKFSFAPKQFHKEISVQVLDEGVMKKEEKPVETDYLQTLPPEVHRMILGYVNMHLSYDTLPFVSMKMFDIVKAGGDWQSVSLCPGGFFGTPFVLGLEALSPVLRSTVRHLNIFSAQAAHPDTHCAKAYAAFYWTVIVQTRWEVLGELNLDSDVKGISTTLLQLGFRKGNFAGLKKLIMTAPDIVARGWCFFNRAKLPRLEELSLNLGPSPVATKVDIKTVSQILGQLTALWIWVAHENLWEVGILPKDGNGIVVPLPKLQHVTLDGEVSPSAMDSIAKELKAFKNSPLSTLKLLKTFIDWNYRLVSSVFPAGVMDNLPMVQVLCITLSLGLRWGEENQRILANITKLDVSFDLGQQAIPFATMRSLTSVALHSRKLDGEEISEAHLSSFMALLTHPRLVELVLVGPFHILGFVEVVKSGITILKLANVGGRMLNAKILDEVIVPFLQSFSDLRDLVLKYSFLQDDAPDMTVSTIRVPALPSRRIVLQAQFWDPEDGTGLRSIHRSWPAEQQERDRVSDTWDVRIWPFGEWSL